MYEKGYDNSSSITRAVPAGVLDRVVVCSIKTPTRARYDIRAFTAVQRRVYETEPSLYVWIRFVRDTAAAVPSLRI